MGTQILWPRRTILPLCMRLRFSGLPFQLDKNYVEGLIAEVLRQMASGGPIERLACAETVLFSFAIRERKLAVYIVLKNRHAVGMRMHHRLLVCSVVDSENTHLLIFDFNLVMFRVHFDGVLNCLLGFRSCRHDFLF